MAFYSVEREFKEVKGKRIVSCKMNGGTIRVDIEHTAGDWITDTTITEDGGYEINFDGPPVRLTPLSGATYNFQER